MPMGVDEAGQHDQVVGVDHFQAGIGLVEGQPAAHGGDPALLDEDIGVRVDDGVGGGVDDQAAAQKQAR